MSAPSVAQQIVSRMVAALMNNTGALDRVFDSREAALARDEFPCIAVDPPEEQQTKPFSDGVDQNTDLVTVAILVASDTWRVDADVIAVQAHALLSRDGPLQASIVSMRKQGRRWAAEEGDLTRGSDSITYQLIYLSSSTDLTVSI